MVRLIFSALLVLLVQPVMAEPPARAVALILEPAKKRDADKVAQLVNLMESELGRRGIARGRMVAPFDAMGLEAGKLALTSARKALSSDHNLSRAPALEAEFTKALFGFKAALGSVSVTDLAETYLGMAATRLAQEDTRFATDYLRAALNVRPGWSDKDFFGARELRDLFRRVKANVSSQQKGELTIKTKKRGAEVYVGDRLAGYTPLSLSLPEGIQLIRLRREGFYTHGWLASVRAGDRLALQYTMKPMAGRSRLMKSMTALGKARTWKKPAQVQATMADIKRQFRVSDVINLRVSRTRKGYRLRGSVAPEAGEPERVDLEVALDATLLERVRNLLARWVPARGSTK